MKTFTLRDPNVIETITGHCLPVRNIRYICKKCKSEMEVIILKDRPTSFQFKCKNNC